MKRYLLILLKYTEAIIKHGSAIANGNLVRKIWKWLYFHANIKYNISVKGSDNMTQADILNKEIEANNGIITTKHIIDIGISKPVFYHFVKETGMEMVSRGIYATKEAWLDDAYILYLRCPEIIYSHEEALFMHGLTDREPLEHIVTVKTGYNPTHISDSCKVYTIKKELYDMGRIIMKDTYGNNIPVYNVERTICDIIRSRNNIEFQDFQSALKGYVLRKDKNMILLMEYAEKLRVSKLIRQYMEVLI